MEQVNQFLVIENTFCQSKNISILKIETCAITGVPKNRREGCISSIQTHCEISTPGLMDSWVRVRALWHTSHP